MYPVIKKKWWFSLWSFYNDLNLYYTNGLKTEKSLVMSLVECVSDKRVIFNSWTNVIHAEFLIHQIMSS